MYAYHPTQTGILFATLILVAPPLGGLMAQEFKITEFFVDQTERLHLRVPPAPSSYFVLYRGGEANRVNQPVDLALGSAAVAEFLQPVTRDTATFFRITQLPVGTPGDADGDGMDDLFELDHLLFLDPLDAADAAMDFDGDGRSNLQEYQEGTDPAIAAQRTEISGEISSPGTEDSYPINGVEGQRIFVDIEEIGGVAQHLNFVLRAPSGAAVVETSGNSVLARLGNVDSGPHQLTETGVYQMIVSGRDEDDAASYRLFVWDVPPPDQKRATVDESLEGAVETPGQSDEWEFSLTASQRQVFLDVEEILDSSQDLNFTLMAPDGSSVIETSGDDVRVNIGLVDVGPIQLPQTGAFRLVVSGLGDDVARYSAALWNVPPPDEQSAALGEVLEGAIETPGRSDEWQFNLTTAQEGVVLAIEEITDESQFLNFTLRAPDGTAVIETSGDALRVRLGLVNSDPMPLSAGEYKLIVSGNGDDTASYRLRLHAES